MKRLVLVLASFAAVAVAGSQAAGEQSFPELIRLPDGFQPEGIAISGHTFYVGSIPTGAVYRGDLRTGRGSILVTGRSGRAAIGVAIDPSSNPFDPGRLVVAGGPTGNGFVYSAKTGLPLATYDLTDLPTFVNDVVVTSEAAFFTDSVNQVLYRVTFGPRRGGQGTVETLPLTGDIQYVQGFNANGIDATPDGQTLILVQSNTGKLFTSTTDGVTSEIDLGGATVVNGDGILLDGLTLYVVQNRDNRIAVVELSPDLSSGEITRFITDPDFDVPTTVADAGERLYAVNARFGTPNPSTARYDVVQVPK